MSTNKNEVNFLKTLSQKIREGASSSKALVQKIKKRFNYIIFHKGAYKLHNFTEVLKFVPTCIFNFWKIPSGIMAFQDAIYEAERELWSQSESIYKLSDKIDLLVEKIIDERWQRGQLNSIIEEHWRYRNIKPKKDGDNIKYFKYRGANFLDESHKDYERDLESIRDLFEDWDLRIPSQFLPDKEAEDRMWDEYDNRYCDYIGGEDDFEFFRSLISRSFYNHHKVGRERSNNERSCTRVNQS
jgi:hypothetical protein|tara:strand:+ start:279 stop:1004 length:726 start_codon:yes stop_codon:yes gene_type:complete